MHRRRGLALALIAATVVGCGAGRPRLRLHGWPDDVDLAEVLQTIVDAPATARSHAPRLVWSKDGRETSVTDPGNDLQPFRPAIKAAAAPPRDATPTALRCDVEKMRCVLREGGETTLFFFSRQGEAGSQYILLDRVETVKQP